MKKLTIILFALVSATANAQNVYDLKQLTDSAMKYNSAITSQNYSLKAAEEQKKQTFTNYFPQVSATGVIFTASKGLVNTEVNAGNYIPESAYPALQQILGEQAAMLANPIEINMMDNGLVASVMAVQPVFMGGQIVNGNKLAQIGVEAEQLKLQQNQNTVNQTIEQYYWQLFSLQEKQKTLDAVDSLLNEINNDVSAAVKAGVAMPNDLLQVKLQMNENQSRRLTLNNGTKLMKLLISQYCGLNDTSFSVSPLVSDDNVNQLTDSINTESAQNTVEYKLLQKNLEAQTLQKKMSVGKNLPQVAVGASLVYHNLLDDDYSAGLLFGTISVPISGWWGGSHEIKRAELKRQQAQEMLEDNTEMLEIRIQKAYNDLEESHSQLALAKNSIEQTEENLRMNRDFYRAGTVAITDLLDAELKYTQALDKYTDAFADLQNKQLAYRQAVGQYSF